MSGGPTVAVRPAIGADEIAIVRQLLSEYAEGLGVDLGFQGFADELATLPGAYSGPDGVLLLAWVGDSPAGCAALRPLAAAVGELKRLFVRPAHRGHGLARRLTAAALDHARSRGFRVVRLDTLPGMLEAQRLYDQLGFREIAPYRPNPVPGARFMELVL